MDLLGLDIFYRRRAGETPRPAEYAASFPTLDPARIARAFAECDMPTPVADPGQAITLSDGLAGALPTIPGYEVLSEVGRGGMGVVYRARHVKLDRVVALKMILSGEYAGPGELARFRREAETAARLQHPNIVQVFDVGEHQGRAYLALEFVDGGTLAEHLGGTPQPPEAAAALVETLARAVHYAHERGVVHRDLKPANILLQNETADERGFTQIENPKEDRSSLICVHPRSSAVPLFPKITDFGLAKRLDLAGQTQSGAILGTPAYMAPEQASGAATAVGPAADTYALGVILYELLTGRPPFTAATPLDTMLQVLSEEPVPPTRLQPKTPRELETICLKCLEKDPARRYASARELADDLRRFQAGEPIRARPAGPAERLLKWCRRRPWQTWRDWLAARRNCTRKPVCRRRPRWPPRATPDSLKWSENPRLTDMPRGP